MNILIIEDDKTISALMGRTLTGAGYECGFAYDNYKTEEISYDEKTQIMIITIKLNPGIKAVG